MALVGDKAEIPRQRPFAAVLSCADSRVQADLLRRSSPVLRDLIRGGQLAIVSGVYNVRTGAVTMPA